MSIETLVFGCPTEISQILIGNKKKYSKVDEIIEQIAEEIFINDKQINTLKTDMSSNRKYQKINDIFGLLFFTCGYISFFFPIIFSNKDKAPEIEFMGKDILMNYGLPIGAALLTQSVIHCYFTRKFSKIVGGFKKPIYSKLLTKVRDKIALVKSKRFMKDNKLYSKQRKKLIKSLQAWAVAINTKLWKKDFN